VAAPLSRGQIADSRAPPVVCAWHASAAMPLGAMLLQAGTDPGGALRGLCYGLAGVYALLSAWALYKLLQLWRAAAGRHAGSGRCCACCGGWSSQRTLHALVLGVGVGAWHPQGKAWA
jgi:hypothetical protein